MQYRRLILWKHYSSGVDMYYIQHEMDIIRIRSRLKSGVEFLPYQ